MRLHNSWFSHVIWGLRASTIVDVAQHNVILVLLFLTGGDDSAFMFQLVSFVVLLMSAYPPRGGAEKTGRLALGQVAQAIC